MPAPSKSIDYTQLAPPAKPAKPAAPFTLDPQRLPLPGVLVNVHKPSPMEAERLKAMGWDGVSPVPANLAEIGDAVREELVRQMAPAEDLDAAGLQDTLRRAKDKAPLQIHEQDMRELPPELQAKYKEVLRSITDQANAANPPLPDVSGMDPSVAQAVLAAQQPSRMPEVVDDRGAPNYATGAAQPKLSELAQAPVPTDNQPSQADKDIPEEARMCARCGFPKHKTEDIEVSEQAKSDYFQAVISLAPFLQTIPLFGERASVTIRTLDPLEVDQLYEQIAKDVQLGLIPSYSVEMEMMARYRLVLQLVELGLPGAHRVFPRHLSGWHPAVPETEIQHKGKLRCVLEMVMADIGTNESAYRMLATKVSQFNIRVHKLEKLISEPDFWKAVGT